MLVSLKTILDIAESRKIAVGAFNITSLEGLRALIEAAEELDQPVIIQFANAAHKQYISLSMIGPIMMFFAENAKVPVCVHLDHGETFEEIHEALELGFTGVMYDGSTLPYEENAANTRLVVEMASEYGASVEAEIGAMASKEDGEAQENAYTDPDLAQKFVEETGVDCLACSFGTVHGLYRTKPNLDIPRVGKIREKTGVPVVMHGGSGVSDEDYRKVIAEGVRKINYYTYAAKYAGEAVQANIAKEEGQIYYHDILTWGRESMKKTYLDTIKVFSNLD